MSAGLFLGVQKQNILLMLLGVLNAGFGRYKIFSKEGRVLKTKTDWNQVYFTNFLNHCTLIIC